MKKLLSSVTALALGAGLTMPALAMPYAPIHAGPPTSPYRNRVPAPSYAPTENLKALGAQYLGRSQIGLMTIDVRTPMQNGAALRAYARASNTPGSHYYRQWIGPKQIGDAFGTQPDKYAKLVRYFKSYGLAVKTWPTRTLITITGNGPRLEGALGVTFGHFRIQDRFSKHYQYFEAPLNSPHPAIGLAALSFGKLMNLPTRHTQFMITSPAQPINSGFSNARVNGATAAQLSRAYDYTDAYEDGYTGQGITIGIIGTGPITPADVTNYRKLYNVPGTSTVSIVPATVNGDSTPPPVTGPCPSTNSGSATSPTPNCNPEDIEAQLDIEQTSMLAYDSTVRFYLAYNGSECEVENSPLGGCAGPATTSQGLDLTDDEMMTAVSDNKADILSLSFDGCETLETATGELQPNPGGDATGTDPTIFEMLASEGIAVFNSSGDSGSAGCQRNAGGSDEPDVLYPTSDPNVTSVGGTTTPMGADGRLVGPIISWGQTTESDGAEGAGMSKDFQTPSYQSALSYCSMRCVPDVVADADPFTGAAVVFNTGLSGGNMEEPVGGTSQAAPDMAAMWALVLQACKQTPSCKGNPQVVDPPSGYTAPASPSYRLGNPNFLWYGAYASKTKVNPFYDIVFGNDAVPPYAAQVAGSEGGPAAYTGGVDPGSVSASAGIDEATGLGAPFGRALIKYIVGI